MHMANASGLAGVELLGEDATLVDDDEEAFATPAPGVPCEQAVASTPSAASTVIVLPASLTGLCRLGRRRVVLISIGASKAVSSACESVLRGGG
jgi:hypothetical protein